MAGIGPGLMILALFMSYLILWALLKGNREGLTGEDESGMSFAEKLRNTWSLMPILLLIGGIIFSIYGGLASPTEAAAVGVVLSMVIARF